MHKATVIVEGEDGETVFRQRVEELDLAALVTLINRPPQLTGRRPRSDKGKPRNHEKQDAVSPAAA